MASESEMMSDLATADANGDTELAQHIASRIKAARAPQHGRWAEVGHKTASLLPMAGGIVGGAMGAPLGLPGMAAGAGLLAATGKSLQHAADSALGYEAPDVVDATKDALKTGATDAATTGAGGLLLKTLAAAARPLAGPMNALGNKLGLRVLTGGTTPLSARKPLPDAAIDEAFQQGAFKPGGTTKSASEALDAARETVGRHESQLIAAMEQQGIRGPDAAKLAQQLEAEAAQKSANSLMSPEPDLFRGAAAELRGKTSGALPLSTAEEMKRTLQFQAQKEYDKIARQFTPMGEAKKALASRMRQAVESEVQAQSALAPDEAAQFVPMKQKLGNIIQAANTAEEGASRAARRSPISLFDMMAATAGYGHGGGLKAAAGLAASKALRTFGPSTGTWALKAGAQGLRNMGALVPQQAGAELGALFGSEVEPTSLSRLLEAIRRKNAMTPQLASSE